MQHLIHWHFPFFDCGSAQVHSSWAENEAPLTNECFVSVGFDTKLKYHES